MKQLSNLISISILCLAFCTACSSDGSISRSDDYEAEIYPDYRDVTIPCNIAPMNFSVLDSSATDYALLIESANSRMWVNASDGDFRMDEDDWHDILASASGKTEKLTFTIARNINGEWVGGKPFTMTVVPDSIDEYITYRLVPPGYQGWYRMGIYQHNLSTSEESTIFDNSHNDGACVNCHTPSSRHSDRSLFHLRTSNGGTYIVRDGIIERLDTKTDSTVSAFVYPSWHPDGKHIAFSTNKTTQTFHTSDKNRIEVYDKESDIVVYDVERHVTFSTPLLKNPDEWETYPTFSPDGKWLYYCTAHRVRNVGINFSQVKYSLCRIAFDTEKEQFGNHVDTIFSSSRGLADGQLQGKSISFPRISPDGNFLVCTIHKYGNFSIWHKDADLYIADLRTLSNTASPTGTTDTTPAAPFLKELKAANSPETESYHTWSSNSHWLVFSSRRDDGLYTRPYFTYIDSEGKAHKPFMLPQDNPRTYYSRLDFSYNIPEFMTSRFSTPMREIFSATQKDSIKVNYK